MTPTRWARVALAAWAVLLAVVCIKPLVRPTSRTVYVTYATAGREFAAGRRLYDVMHPDTDNFRYSPLVAAGFVPFSALPLGVGGVLWRVLGAAVFLSGLAAWARRVAPGVSLPQLFLLAVPLSASSLHNGQANTLVIGLMLWGALLAAGGRWSLGAVLVAGAVLFKGYPLALGLLIALAAPVRFGLPFVGALAAGLALPYALQAPDYVTGQYRYWAENLGRDDRTGFPLWGGMQDAHMLLRVLGLNLPLSEFRYVEAGVGAAAAAVVAYQLWTGLDRRQIVLNALTLGICWMTTFGPAVESSTFILLAPVMACELLDGAGRPRWARAVAIAGAGLLLLSFAVLTLPRQVHRPVIALGTLPLGALLVAAAAVGRVVTARPAEPGPASVVVAPPARQAA